MVRMFFFIREMSNSRYVVSYYLISIYVSVYIW